MDDTTGKHPSSWSEASRSFLQDRLCLFSKVLFVLSVVFLVLPFVVVALFVSLDTAVQSVFTPRRLLQVGKTVFVGVVWLLVARVPLGTRALQTADAAIQTVPAALIVTMFVGMSTGTAGALSIALALGHFFVLRSVIVPSSGRHTFWLTTLLSVAATCGFALFAVFDPTWSSFEQPAAPAHGVINLGIWLLFAILSSTVASRVIYGLREEVKKARTVGQYEIQRRIGEGGMGVVFEATHAMLRRRTAVKLVPPTKVKGTTLARFEREVKLTARLTHPNTISIYDYGRTPDGIFYYAMELLQGIDLQRLVEREGPVPPGRVVRILSQVLASLAEAHDMGLIHRDIKPANVVLTERGGEPDVVKVLDFGLVKDLDTEEATDLTATKALTGTPLYMSPESIQSPDQVGPRSDLYAVAAVGYFLLTGTEVFRGATVIEICAHHLHTIPESPSSRLSGRVPADLEALLLKGLAKAPDERPANARAFRDALRRCESPRWSEEEARAWWDEHRDALRSPPATSEPSPETLLIDLGRR